MVLRRCVNLQSAGTRSLGDALRATGDRNIFNPSLVAFAGHQHLVYRALDDGGQKPFRALHLTAAGERSGPSWRRNDLSAHAEAHGVSVVADPKLTVLGEEVFITFNTGYHSKQNNIYLMRILPDLGPPQRCILAPRQAVEKNWGFFTVGAGLRALYSLQPLVFLRLASGRLGSGDLTFARSSSPPLGALGGLTMGTQPSTRNDDLLLIAHERLRWRGRRGYIGRAVTVRQAASEAPEILVSPTRLVHSFRALRPSGSRHNPNLLFATYFSGLALHGPSARLAYGVNDLDFGFADVRTDQLWP